MQILDVLPTMWMMALAFFEQAAASPAAVVDGTLEFIVKGVSEEKLTARARRTALDMARIRELAAGGAAFERSGHLRCGADHPRVARALKRHADDEHGR
eukprot:2587547-Pleurochrysis_carterae.AAC.1